MRTGCIVAAIVLVVVIGIAGFFGYQMINESFDIPEQLEAYNDPELMRSLVKSKAPAPPDTAHLTQERVQKFMGALDSLGSGWQGLALLIDSLQSEKGQEQFSIWSSPALINQMMQTPLTMRRALVNYLNLHNISWEEYVWLKERTIAASGITLRETDSSLNAVVSAHFKMGTPDMITTKSKETATDFFHRVEALRMSGAVDSSDIALVAPYRETLLSKGLPALAGIESKQDLDGGLNVSTSRK